jgi:hypothetical protein
MLGKKGSNFTGIVSKGVSASQLAAGGKSSVLQRKFAKENTK